MIVARLTKVSLKVDNEQHKLVVGNTASVTSTVLVGMLKAFEEAGLSKEHTLIIVAEAGELKGRQWLSFLEGAQPGFKTERLLRTSRGKRARAEVHYYPLKDYTIQPLSNLFGALAVGLDAVMRGRNVIYMCRAGMGRSLLLKMLTLSVLLQSDYSGLLSALEGKTLVIASEGSRPAKREDLIGEWFKGGESEQLQLLNSVYKAFAPFITPIQREGSEEQTG